jgi:hypothetical protein
MDDGARYTQNFLNSEFLEVLGKSAIDDTIFVLKSSCRIPVQLERDRTARYQKTMPVLVMNDNNADLFDIQSAVLSSTFNHMIVPIISKLSRERQISLHNHEASNCIMNKSIYLVLDFNRTI